MARLVCSRCGATHRVSVVQLAYRALPCRRCGSSIPLVPPRKAAVSLSSEVSFRSEATDAALRPAPAGTEPMVEPPSREAQAVLAVAGQAPGPLDTVAASAAPERCPRCELELRKGALKCPGCRQFLSRPAGPGGESLTHFLLYAIAVSALAIALLATLYFLRTPRPL